MTAGEDLLQTQLQQAYDKLRAGFKLGARQIIRVLMQTNPHSPDAWYLLAQAAFTPTEARRALGIALTLDEGGYWAHRALTRLRARYPLEAGASDAAPKKAPSTPSARPEQAPSPPAQPATAPTEPALPPTQAEPLPWATGDPPRSGAGAPVSWAEEVSLAAASPAGQALPADMLPPAQQDDDAWADLVAQVKAAAETPPAEPAPPSASEVAAPSPRLRPVRSVAPPGDRQDTDSKARLTFLDDEEQDDRPKRRLRPTFPKARPGVELTREQKKKLREAEDALWAVKSKGAAVPLGRKKAEMERAIAVSVALYREVLYTGAGEAKHWFDMATALEFLADRVAVIAEARVPRGYTPLELAPVAQIFEPVLNRPPDWQAVADLCYEIASACKEAVKLVSGQGRGDRNLREQAEAKLKEMKTALAELQPLL